MKVLTKDSFVSEEAYDTYREERKSYEFQILVLCGLLAVASLMIIANNILF